MARETRSSANMVPCKREKEPLVHVPRDGQATPAQTGIDSQVPLLVASFAATTSNPKQETASTPNSCRRPPILESVAPTSRTRTRTCSSGWSLHHASGPGKARKNSFFESGRRLPYRHRQHSTHSVSTVSSSLSSASNASISGSCSGRGSPFAMRPPQFTFSGATVTPTRSRAVTLTETTLCNIAGRKFLWLGLSPPPQKAKASSPRGRCRSEATPTPELAVGANSSSDSSKIPVGKPSPPAQAWCGNKATTCGRR